MNWGPADLPFTGNQRLATVAAVRLWFIRGKICFKSQVSPAFLKLTASGTGCKETIILQEIAYLRPAGCAIPAYRTRENATV